VQAVCETISLKVDVPLSELMLEPTKRNLDTICGRALSADATADVKTPLSAKLDKVIDKVDRNTRDDKLLAKLYDILVAARSALSGDAIWTSEGSSSAAPAAAAIGQGGGGFGGGLAGVGGAGAGRSGESGAPLPADWSEVRQAGKVAFVNSKTGQKSDKRPAVPRQSVSELMNAIEDLFQNKKQGSTSLCRVASELGEKIDMPKPGRKAIVLVLGNGGGPQSFIEHYIGDTMKNAGLGTNHAFCIVTEGRPGDVEKGDLGLQRLNVPEVNKLRSIRGIERSVLAEQMLPGGKFDRDLDQLVFVKGPSIEGPVKTSGQVSTTLEAIRNYVATSQAPLREEFRAMAGDGSTVNARSFVKGVQSMQLNLQQQDITAVFEALDVTGDGQIEWDEFQVAFKPSDANYQISDVESAVLRFADVADQVLIMADPVRLRFQLRELQLYSQLISPSSNLRAKTHMCLWVTEHHGGGADLGKNIEMVKAALKKQVSGWDEGQLDVCHLPNTQIKSFKVANCLESYFSHITSAVDQYLDPLLTKVQALIRRALNLVNGPTVDSRKKELLLQVRLPRNPKSGNPKPEPETRNPKPVQVLLRPKPSTLHQPSNPQPRFPTLKPKP
jgi:hypothetical protein